MMNTLIIISFAMVCILWFIPNVCLAIAHTNFMLEESPKPKWYKLIAWALALFFAGFIILFVGLAIEHTIDHIRNAKKEKLGESKLRKKKCA